jgi:putative membrane-bound dehydrogenase-like protein
MQLLKLIPLLTLAVVAARAEQPAPLPPAEAAARMKLPAGFRATLFAGEPDIVQPIAFTFDDRGRLWVVEGMSYPRWQAEDAKNEDRHDRVVILEDTDGDGKFDKRKVFADKLINLSGIEIGFGGVYLCSTPNLLFIPDANRDDVPDAPPNVMLNGFSYDVKHNVFNGLTWGPDGWLYGMHGILGTSRVGRPALATNDPKRVAINCGVWRFHPTSHAFEVVASGTTNPWGLDFDDVGEMFITNCVIAHVFHVVPGAHYKRMYGQDLNPNVYALMQTCADHLHWGGGDWTESRGNQPRHSEAGGGHAHVGAMIYLGDNWPNRYRDTLFTCNLHGLRVNNDTLVHSGSGYVAKHGKDLLFSEDQWFRGLALKYGPDGGVFLSDWSDTGECHDYEDIHRESGRIFEVTYGDVAKREPFDVAKMSDAELVKLQLHRNEWFVRHARRVLQERAENGLLSATTPGLLREMIAGETNVPKKLRVVWAAYAVHALDAVQHAELKSPDEYVRAWAIRLGVESRKVSVESLESMAASDPSPVVRLHLASALQRLQLSQRWRIAEALAGHVEDAADANIPLMIWYGIEPAVKDDPDRALRLIEHCKIPVVREFVARRLAQ